MVSKRLPGGSRHIGQRLKQKLGARMMRAIARTAPKPQPDAAAPESRSEMWRILDLARWAPSGDNSQPWRFRIDGDDAVTIIIHHEAGTNVYEYNDGQPTLLSAGHLLETLRIAASRYGRRMEWSHRRVNEGATVLTRTSSASACRASRGFAPTRWMASSGCARLIAPATAPPR